MSTSEQRVANLEQLIAEQKEITFTRPEETDDTEALGVLIAIWAGWDGRKIAQVFAAALEDANFHSECAAVVEMFHLEDN